MKSKKTKPNENKKTEGEEREKRKREKERKRKRPGSLARMRLMWVMKNYDANKLNGKGEENGKKRF